ncbi:MAG: HIT family protein [Pseudomonadota bacterium]
MSEFTLHPQLDADSHFVCDLPLSMVLLINDRQYPWYVLVPRVSDIKEAHQLNTTDRQQLIIESDALCIAMESLFTPDKMNVAAIGNMVPQLHIHHIARYRHDAAWPAPVWGALPAIPYQADDSQRMITRLSAQVIGLNHS